jgi:hypothetical protein
MRKYLKYNHLLANIVIFANVALLTQALQEEERTPIMAPCLSTTRDSIRLTSAAPTGWAQNSTPLLG